MPRRIRHASGVPDDAEPQDRSQGAAGPAARRGRRSRSRPEPEGGLEQTIAAIWCEVLELPEVGVDTNFADVGGHSLAMVQVLGRLKERVSQSVTLVDLFRYTTIRALARFLSAASQPDPALAASASRAASRRAAMSGRGRPR